MVTVHLDVDSTYQKHDQHFALRSIAEIASQITAIWELSKELTFPVSYKKYNKVVVAGMGGSILGTDVIRHLFKEQLSVPLIIAPDYDVPAFVDNQTLVIVSSYSGNTEETFSALEDAYSKKAQITGITSGGKIADFLTSHNLPALIYEPLFNPSNSPRMALGYSIFGQIALCQKLGLISLSEQDISQLLATIASVHLKCSNSVAQSDNPAKLMAWEFYQKLPIITGADFVEGGLHIFANQLNENSKTLAEYRVVPEMHHHLLEGFEGPELIRSEVIWLLIESDLYHPRNRRRMELTAELLSNKHIQATTLSLTGTTKLDQIFELIVFAAYTAFYLAMIYEIDPIPDPNVAWIKNNL